MVQMNGVDPNALNRIYSKTQQKNIQRAQKTLTDSDKERERQKKKKVLYIPRSEVEKQVEEINSFLESSGNPLRLLWSRNENDELFLYDTEENTVIRKYFPGDVPVMLASFFEGGGIFVDQHF